MFESDSIVKIPPSERSDLLWAFLGKDELKKQ
jgi:hypothetical protein